MKPNVGILVVTHGDSGAAMLVAVAALVGQTTLDDAAALAIAPGEGRESIARRLDEAVGRLDRGSGVLIACDLLGSTPANCSVELKRSGRNLEVVFGVNLPMLVKLASMDRQVTLASLADLAVRTATRSIRAGDAGDGGAST
ncbi:MAG: PTS sugar transporter subunit IIA [Pseudomonadota bacterium]